MSQVASDPKNEKKTRSRCVILPVWKAELGCSSRLILLRFGPLEVQGNWLIWCWEGIQCFSSVSGGINSKTKSSKSFWIGWVVVTVAGLLVGGHPKLHHQSNLCTQSGRYGPGRAGRRNAQPIYGNAGKKCLGPLWCRLKYPLPGWVHPTWKTSCHYRSPGALAKTGHCCLELYFS